MRDMREAITELVDRVKGPNRLERFISWLKSLPERISKLDRPIDYLLEGGPLLRGIVLLVVLSILIALPWILAGEFTQNRSDRIALFSAITSIVLTLGLLWIYLSIAESERDQASLINEQTELQEKIQSLQEDQVGVMAAEYEPVIEILEYGHDDQKPPTEPLSLPDGPPHRGDFIKITLSNLSDAIATNLRLRLLIDYTGPGSLTGSADIPLSRIESDRTWTSKPGGIIRGEQTEVEYHCIAGLTLPPVGRDDRLPFTYCLSYLFDTDEVSRIRIGVLLVYEDRKGAEHEIELEGFEIKPSDRPEIDPTFARIRNSADEVPIPVIRNQFLRKGVSEIPPRYSH